MLAHALLRVGLAAAVLAPLALPAGAQTLKTVKERGMLNCGISEGVLGFSTPDGKGGASGFHPPAFRLRRCRLHVIRAFRTASANPPDGRPRAKPRAAKRFTRGAAGFRGPGPELIAAVPLGTLPKSSPQERAHGSRFAG